MLLDLGRNDVGKVSKVNTVKVTERFNVENAGNNKNRDKSTIAGPTKIHGWIASIIVDCRPSESFSL